MSRSACGSLFQASGPAKENARSPSALRHLGSWYSELSPERSPWSTLVDGESLYQVGKVDGALLHVDRVHHAAQLELNAAMNRKPVELSQGGSDVVARSEVHYEASSGVLDTL